MDAMRTSQDNDGHVDHADREVEGEGRHHPLTSAG